MTRAFRHTFEPTHQNPIPGQDVHLTIQEIEHAGLLEVVQTPGARFGSWAILGGLLQSGTRFVFREPLGQAREVKVALSGLFGRFVARAYLQKYFSLSIFNHLGSNQIDLDGRHEIRIERCSRGDLPDWVACTNNLTDLTVAEAKGCHDWFGPKKALKRAWDQAGRIEIFVNKNQVTVKRIAIATRWGIHTGGPPDPWIAVRNPIDEGDLITPDNEEAMFAGLVRHHIANMISPLGHAELAEALRELSSLQSDRVYQNVAQHARRLLDEASIRNKSLVTKDPEFGDIIGGVITRAGPVIDAVVSPTDVRTLERLDLSPVFIGVERKLVYATINEDYSSMRTILANGSKSGEEKCIDHAAGRIIRLNTVINS